MPKYSVTIQYERTQTIEVEADSKDEAIRIVNEGEFENDQITDTEDDYVDILGATLITK
jgi:DNA-dependent RNA polymerase auxiliary subunit epsilon